MIFSLLIFGNYNINSHLPIEIFGLTLIFAIAIDLIFGEFPTKIHPVVLFGKFIDYFTRYFIKIRTKFSGVYLTISVICISISLAILILLITTINIFIFTVVLTLLLSSMFSFRLLLSSANDIKKDLSNDINKARKSMSFLVSRKTDKLSETQIISAAIETLTENITDSCVSVFFYYLFFGIFTLTCILLFNSLIDFNNLFNSFFNIFFNFNYIIFIDNIIINDNASILINKNLFYIISILSLLATVFYRVINTLDAMVGYKNHKYLLIGWFPAKLDDLLNFIPSRFSGLIIIISAFLLNLNWKNSYFIFKRDSKNCPSPNSGFTMSAAAGALDIQLKKENVYIIGEKNQKLTLKHIDNAIKLSKMSIIISTIILLGIFYLTLHLLLNIYLLF